MIFLQLHNKDFGVTDFPYYTFYTAEDQALFIFYHSEVLMSLLFSILSNVLWQVSNSQFLFDLTDNFHNL